MRSSCWLVTAAHSPFVLVMTVDARELTSFVCMAAWTRTHAGGCYVLVVGVITLAASSSYFSICALFAVVVMSELSCQYLLGFGRIRSRVYCGHYLWSAWKSPAAATHASVRDYNATNDLFTHAWSQVILLERIRSVLPIAASGHHDGCALFAAIRQHQLDHLFDDIAALLTLTNPTHLLLQPAVCRPHRLHREEQLRGGLDGRGKTRVATAR